MDVRQNMKHFYRYLPISEEVRQEKLYLLAGGYTFIPPHSPYPPLRHPDDHHFQWNQGRVLREYQLIYITRGDGVFESRTLGRRRVSAGDLYVLFPDEWHRYSPNQETGWDEYWLAFSGDEARRMVGEFALSPERPIMKTQVSSDLKDEFGRVMDELRSEEPGYQRIVSSRAEVILATAYALSQRIGFVGSEILAVIEKAKSVLSDRIDQNVNMEELASSLNVGYSLFRKEFRAYTGFSPAHYHLELRINYAIRLISTTTLPLAVIGERIGLDAPGYFSRLFKRKTGYKPSEYRQMTQNRDDES